MKKEIIGATLLAASGLANAGLISIDFDSAQAGYTPLAQGVTQIIDNQFASLGIIFENAQVGDCTGGVGSDPVHLYGPGPGSCGDTTPDINMYFVDPSNSLNNAYTDFFSILVTDGNGTTINAYDINDSLIGSVSTVAGGFDETLTLSGIGNITWLNIFTPSDATAYDDIVFEEVTAVASVPETATLALLGLGLAGIGFSRRRS